MTLQEIFDRVLILSGQFLISQDKIELDIDKFKTVVSMCLGTYSKFAPIDMWLFKEVNTNRQYVFSILNTPTGIPEQIVDLVPVRISGVYPFFLRDYDKPRSNLDIKVEFPWVYRKPILTLPVSAEFDIQVLYFHQLTNTTTPGGCKVEVTSIDDTHTELFNLLTAKFLQGIGRSRRAFTLDQMPLKTDAAELVREGEAMEKDAIEALSSREMKWYLAWR